MNRLIGGLFEFNDKIQMNSLNHRLERQKVITANVANAETPGFRAIGYDFEEALQELQNRDRPFPMAVSHDQHFKGTHVEAGGKVSPDIHVRPSESVSQDGNTVDIDDEMARSAENQILYRATVEILNRKVGILRYAINGGR